MNSEQFMALQKYLWMFKTQYQTRYDLCEHKTSIFIDYYKHVKLQKLSSHKMSTTLEETLRYALDYCDYGNDLP